MNKLRATVAASALAIAHGLAGKKGQVIIMDDLSGQGRRIIDNAAQKIKEDIHTENARKFFQPKDGHVNLAAHATKDLLGRRPASVEAAQAAFEEGKSPRGQLDEARKGGAKLGYTSHQGAKQRARALARMEKAAKRSDV